MLFSMALAFVQLIAVSREVSAAINARVYGHAVLCRVTRLFGSVRRDKGQMALLQSPGLSFEKQTSKEHGNLLSQEKKKSHSSVCFP